MSLPKVSETIANMREQFENMRNNEVSALAEVLPQHVTDHHDAAAYREIDRQVNALARTIDRMTARLRKWEDEALKIEQAVENFYGD